MASLSSTLRPPSLFPQTTHRNLHIITFHLPPSSARFPVPTKLRSPFELSSPLAAPNWRTKVSFFPSFLENKGKKIEEIKQELFDAIAPLDRGAEATPEDQERIDRIVRKLEALNSIEDPLKSDLLNGKWELIYTTSTSILKSQRPKILQPNGKIYQAINADTLRAQNMETWPFFNQATADLIPLNSRRVAVRFDTFKIAGLACVIYIVRNEWRRIIQIPIRAPDRPAEALGQLEITYLDEEIRVSRGNRGNLFVLKMADPSYRVPI